MLLQVHILKGLEITYQFIFLSARSVNIKSVKKKNKEKYGKIENFFFVAGFLYRSDVSAFS